MARWMDPTLESEATYNRWIQKRPEHVRKVAERFDIWSLYLYTPTNHRVTIYSFDEHKVTGDVTLTVNVLGKYNHVSFERRVFGVAPDMLVECDLPGPDELLGAEMTQEEAEEMIEQMKKDNANDKS